MEYSKYDIEQLKEIYNYQELCNCFLELAKDDETRYKLESILYQGGYKNYGFTEHKMGIDGPIVDASRRAGLAYLALTNPDTFDELAKGDITYFHGTNDDMAINRIFYYGLTSANELDNMGIRATSGENPNRKREFTSLTDVLDIASDYATMRNRNLNKQTFPAIVGISKESINLNRDRIRDVNNTSLPEIGLKPPFPPKFISCVLVPKDKVELTKRMAQGQPHINILAFDGLVDDKFYRIDIDGGIEIDMQKYDDFKAKYGLRSIRR